MAELATRPVGAPEGNRNGFRGQLFNDRIRQVLQANDRQKLVQVVNELVDAACAGDMRAIEILLERVDGKVAQSIEVTRKGELDDMPIHQLQLEIARRLQALQSVTLDQALPSTDPGYSGAVEVLGASGVAETVNHTDKFSSVSPSAVCTTASDGGTGITGGESVGEV